MGKYTGKKLDKQRDDQTSKKLNFRMITLVKKSRQTDDQTGEESRQIDDQTGEKSNQMGV